MRFLSNVYIDVLIVDAMYILILFSTKYVWEQRVRLKMFCHSCTDCWKSVGIEVYIKNQNSAVKRESKFRYLFLRPNSIIFL